MYLIHTYIYQSFFPHNPSTTLLLTYLRTKFSVLLDACTTPCSNDRTTLKFYKITIYVQYICEYMFPFSRFQVNVQFCVEECNPVDCGEGVVSYGRRRRRDAVTSAPRATTLVPEPYASRLVFDQNLGQEVISVDTPLSKEIIVNQGTKVDSFRSHRSQDGFSNAGGGTNEEYQILNYVLKSNHYGTFLLHGCYYLCMFLPISVFVIILS